MGNKLEVIPHFAKGLRNLGRKIWDCMSNLRWIKKIFSWLYSFFKFQWIDKYRKSCLLIAAFIGFGFFYLFLRYWPDLAPHIGLSGNSDSRIRTSLALLSLSLPMAFVLWLFRTRDTLENINRPAFFDALKLLSPQDSSNPKQKEFGIRQLAHLRNEVKAHVAEIDALTKRLVLNSVILTGINLKGFNLQEANLQGTDLQGANLQGANLQRVDLQGANLQGANLQGADLREAHLQRANLRGARYNARTRFPKGFDPERAGMEKVD